MVGFIAMCFIERDICICPTFTAIFCHCCTTDRSSLLAYVKDYNLSCDERRQNVIFLFVVTVELVQP